MSHLRIMKEQEDGLECIRIETESGLSFAVAPGYAMSLKSACFRGRNLTYRPPGGFRRPMAGLDDTYFEGGLMFTCGLDSTGPANGPYRQHGMLRFLAAEDVSADRFPESGGERAEVSGTIRQELGDGQTLELRRTICCENAAPEIRIHDRIRNCSQVPAGWMIMYHFNLGWPLISPTARLMIPSTEIMPKNAVSAAAIGRHLQIEEPQADWKPQALYHSLDRKARSVSVTVENPQAGLGASIEMDPGELPFLTQWRCFQSTQYVLGLEPCNVPPLGRTRTKEEGRLPVLLPGEEAHCKVIFRVWEMEDAIGK